MKGNWFKYTDIDIKLFDKYKMVNNTNNDDLICTRWCYDHLKNVFGKSFLSEKGIFFDCKIQNEFDSQVELIPKLNRQNKYFLDLINSSKEPVCLHIRRGDYVKLSHAIWRKFPEEYILNFYANTLKKIGSKAVFCFSDDLQFVKNKLVPLIPKDVKLTIVDCNSENDAAFELELMKNCKHFISNVGGFCKLAYGLCKNKDKQMFSFGGR